MKPISILPLGFSLLLASGLCASAMVDPGLSGNKATSGWAGQFHIDYYPTITAAPRGTGFSIKPNLPDSDTSGAVQLNKLAADPDNDFESSAYVSTKVGKESYIYAGLAGGGALVTNPAVPVAHFSISSTNAIENLQTVVFQMGASFNITTGQLFPTNTTITLSYNGGDQRLVADLSLITSSITLTEPGYGNALRKDYLFQWDLSGITETIDSFVIEWAVTNHAQSYTFQLDQSDVYSEAIPEPSTWSLMAAAGIAGMIMIRRKRFAQAA
jgi:hypothetical protein